MKTHFASFLKSPVYLNQVVARRLAARSLAHFMMYMFPTLVLEEVNYIVCEYFDKVVQGKIRRLACSTPPRTSKSITFSQYGPAHAVGNSADSQILCISHTTLLSEHFGRKVRDIILDPRFRDVFPDVKLNPNEQAAAHWSVINSDPLKPDGGYYGAGAGAAIAGRGFHLGILDDILSEAGAFSDTKVKALLNWIGPGFLTRAQPERNAVIAVATRWRLDDPIGYLLETARENDDAEQWETLVIPAELDKQSAQRMNGARISVSMARRLHHGDDLPRPVYEERGSFSPERHPLKDLLATKAMMSPGYYSALYQQNPVSESGAILKRMFWREWPSVNPPRCFQIFTFYDTAIELTEAHDFSARTTWGVFQETDEIVAAILLESWQDRVETPDLSAEIVRHFREWNPDIIYIEKRASGAPLLQSLRRSRDPKIPVRPWLPPGRLIASSSASKDTRLRGKIPRAHATAQVMSQANIYYMGNVPNGRALQQCMEFPAGKHDDLVDTVTMAILTFRERNLLTLSDQTGLASRSVEDLPPDFDRSSSALAASAQTPSPFVNEDLDESYTDFEDLDEDEASLGGSVVGSQDDLYEQSTTKAELRYRIKKRAQTRNPLNPRYNRTSTRELKAFHNARLEVELPDDV